MPPTPDDVFDFHFLSGAPEYLVERSTASLAASQSFAAAPWHDFDDAVGSLAIGQLSRANHEFHRRNVRAALVCTSTTSRRLALMLPLRRRCVGRLPMGSFGN